MKCCYHTLFITRQCGSLDNNIMMLRRLSMKLLLELSDEIPNSLGNAVELKLYFDCQHLPLDHMSCTSYVDALYLSNTNPLTSINVSNFLLGNS